MRILLLSILVVLSSVVSAADYVYLVERYRPVDQYQSERYKKNEVIPLACDLDATYGFTLHSSYRPYQKGFVEYDIHAEYEQISFVVAHTRQGAYGAHREKGVIAVYADDKVLMRRMIAPYDAPQHCSFDIAGVNKLRFVVEKGDIYVGFADIRLYNKDVVRERSTRQTDKVSRTVFVKNTPSYFYNSIFATPIITNEDGADEEMLKINGVAYQSGVQFESDIESGGGAASSWAYFYLGGKYGKVRFVVGPRNVDTDAGSSRLAVISDNKVIYQRTVKYSDMAEAVILDVTGRQWIAFENTPVADAMMLCVGNIVAYPHGIEPEGVKAAGRNKRGGRLAGLPDMCKLLSAVPPINFYSDMPRGKALFDGSSPDKSFDMGGELFSEGFFLSNQRDQAASVTFDLDNQFDNISFSTGWINHCGVLKTDTLMVLADDSLVYLVPLKATRGNVVHNVAIDRCRKLTFTKKGINAVGQPIFAVADLIAFRGNVIENSLFVHPRPELPQSTELMSLSEPFLYFNKHGAPLQNNAFVLQTLAVDSAERQPSCAAFNTYGGYSTVTFTVECVQPKTSSESIQLEEFSIGADHNMVSKIILYDTMEPTTYVVDIKHCQQLLFYLDCSNATSAQYRFSNIRLSNDEVQPYHSPFE